MKVGYVYILTNKHNDVLYVGVTSDLLRRLQEHREGSGGSFSFTKKYHVDKLVYFEQADSIEGAIEREKQLKAGSRKKKIELIQGANPEWKDLVDEIRG